MTGKKGMRSGKSRLEDWQWRECEQDFVIGAPAMALAERYGVTCSCIRKHMSRRGIVPWYERGERDAGV